MPDLATFHIEHTPTALIVSVAGEVDLSNAEELNTHAQKLLAADVSTAAVACVDLSEVTFFDSAGINTLFDLNTRLAAAGHSLEVVAPPDSRARRVLDLVQFDRFATLTDTLSASDN